uniref:Uncharacterized protein n=1 Tax=Anguilla anguilla TaxID=7936 RepID=A0A0E9TKW5_ANGAN
MQTQGNGPAGQTSPTSRFQVKDCTENREINSWFGFADFVTACTKITASEDSAFQ